MTIAELTSEMDELENEYQSGECQAFQTLLETDLRSLMRLRQVEQRWEQTLRNGTPFNFELDQDITRRYQKWVTNARVRLKQLQIQEKEKECYPESADEFRQRLDEVEEHLLERIQDERAVLANLRDFG